MLGIAIGLLVLWSSALEANALAKPDCEASLTKGYLAASSPLAEREIPEFLASNQGIRLTQITHDRDRFLRKNLDHLVKKLNATSQSWQKDQVFRFKIDFADRFAVGSPWIRDFIRSLESRGEAKYLSDAMVRQRIHDWLKTEATPSERSELSNAFKAALNFKSRVTAGQTLRKRIVDEVFEDWCFVQLSSVSHIHFLMSHPNAILLNSKSSRSRHLMATLIGVDLPKPSELIRKRLSNPSWLSRMLSALGKSDAQLSKRPSFINMAANVLANSAEQRWTADEIRVELNYRYTSVTQQLITEWIDDKKRIAKSQASSGLYSKKNESMSDSSSELLVHPTRSGRIKSRPKIVETAKEPVLVSELRAAVDDLQQDTVDILRQTYFAQFAIDAELMKQLLQAQRIVVVPEVYPFLKTNAHSIVQYFTEQESNVSSTFGILIPILRTSKDTAAQDLTSRILKKCLATLDDIKGEDYPRLQELMIAMMPHLRTPRQHEGFARLIRLLLSKDIELSPKWVVGMFSWSATQTSLIREQFVSNWRQSIRLSGKVPTAQQQSRWKVLLEARQSEGRQLISFVLLAELPLSPLYYREFFDDLDQSEDAIVNAYAAKIKDTEYRSALLRRLIVSSNVRGDYVDFLNDEARLAEMTENFELRAIDSLQAAKDFEAVAVEVGQYKEMVSLAHSFQHELDRGRLPFDISQQVAVGYDIYSASLIDEPVRRIEVKHRLKDRSRIYLTDSEFIKASRLEKAGEPLYLYLVEVDLSDLRSPKMITYRGINEIHIVGYDTRAGRFYVTLDSIENEAFEE